MFLYVSVYVCVYNCMLVRMFVVSVCECVSVCVCMCTCVFLGGGWVCVEVVLAGLSLGVEVCIPHTLPPFLTLPSSRHHWGLE